MRTHHQTQGRSIIPRRLDHGKIISIDGIVHSFGEMRLSGMAAPPP
jgi:hypothetical protein